MKFTRHVCLLPGVIASNEALGYSALRRIICVAQRLHRQQMEQELRAACSSVQRRLQDLEQQNKKLQQEKLLLKRRGKRRSEFIADVAFTLFVWSCPCGALCQAYLAQELSSTPTENELQFEDVEKRYLGASLETINAIMAKTGALGKRKLDAAYRFQRDFNLAGWIEQENARKGIAPTVSLVLRHLSSQKEPDDKSGETMAVKDKLVPSSKWVQRFRRRWQLKHGRFGARDRVLVEELRSKANLSYHNNKPTYPQHRTRQMWLATWLHSECASLTTVCTQTASLRGGVYVDATVTVLWGIRRQCNKKRTPPRQVIGKGVRKRAPLQVPIS